MHTVTCFFVLFFFQSLLHRHVAFNHDSVYNIKILSSIHKSYQSEVDINLVVTKILTSIKQTISMVLADMSKILFNSF